MTEQIKERRPALAAFLSLVLMGLGQLYNGQLRRAVVFLVLDIFLAVLAATNSTFLLTFHGVMIIYFGGLIYVGIRFFAVIDAFIGARRIGAVELQRYNRWYVYVSVLSVAMIIPMVFESPIKTYSIPGGSMMPTLIIGDHVSANKNAYHDRAPESGDVVVFRLPKDNQTEYMQRLIGLPGDEIQVKRGLLHINDAPVPRSSLGATTYVGNFGYVQQVTAYAETLPNGVEHSIYEVSDNSGVADNTKVFKVPPGHYFMMGDNRDNSMDSRFGVGFVPAVDLVSRAEVLWFSHNGTASWWQFWRWPQAIRFSRIGKEID